MGEALGSLEIGLSVPQESPVGSFLPPLSFELQSNLSAHIGRCRVGQKWLGFQVFPLPIKQTQKLECQAGWCAPISPAIQETEAGVCRAGGQSESHSEFN